MTSNEPTVIFGKISKITNYQHFTCDFREQSVSCIVKIRLCWTPSRGLKQKHPSQNIPNWSIQRKAIVICTIRVAQVVRAPDKFPEGCELERQCCCIRDPVYAGSTSQAIRQEKCWYSWSPDAWRVSKLYTCHKVLCQVAVRVCFCFCGNKQGAQRKEPQQEPQWAC